MPITPSDLAGQNLARHLNVFHDAYAREGVQAMFGAEAVNGVRITSAMADFCTVVPTQTEVVDMDFLGDVAYPSLFADERRRRTVFPWEYEIRDQTRELTIEVRRRALEDDQSGQARMKFAQMARSIVRGREKDASVALRLSAATVCYDGQYLVDTDHPIPGTGATASNKGTSALSASSLQAAFQAGAGFVDDFGEPKPSNFDLLIVGPKLIKTAQELVESPVVVVNVGDGAVGSGATAATNYRNVYQGALRVALNPYLVGDYDDYWFLVDTSADVKPIVMTYRTDVGMELYEQSDPATHWEAFNRDNVLWGSRERYGVGYGLWRSIYGGIL